MGTRALRGQVYRIDLGEDIGKKYYVVVSNNPRNRNLDTVLACRITSSRKEGLGASVPLTPADPYDGFVLCDDIDKLYESELTPGAYIGAITAPTMRRIAEGLKLALGI